MSDALMPKPQVDVEGFDNDDDFGDDDEFVPVDPATIAWGALARGEYRRDVAARLGLTLSALNSMIAEETTRRTATRPSERERVALVETILDVATKAACDALEAPGEADPETLRVLVSIAELRLRMIPQTRHRTNLRKDAS